MNRLIIAFAATVALSPVALAQTSQATNPVPGTSANDDTAMPAGTASQVITSTDAPTASTEANTSKVPVPGNSTGVASAMPAAEASKVIVNKDATSVPADTSVPVPGTSAGDDSVTKTN